MCVGLVALQQGVLSVSILVIGFRAVHVLSIGSDAYGVKAHTRHGDLYQ